MKKLLIAIVAFSLPALAFANQVEVYPTITNAHGGIKSAADITVCGTVNGLQDCETGVPYFSAPVGSIYHITVNPPAGYSFTTHGDCDGTVAGDDASMTCFVDYADGAPIVDQTQTTSVPVLHVATQSAPTLESGITQIISTTTDEGAKDALRLQIIDLLKQIIALLTQQIAQAK